MWKRTIASGDKQKNVNVLLDRLMITLEIYIFRASNQLNDKQIQISIFSFGIGTYFFLLMN